MESTETQNGDYRMLKINVAEKLTKNDLEILRVGFGFSPAIQERATTGLKVLFEAERLGKLKVSNVKELKRLLTGRNKPCVELIEEYERKYGFDSGKICFCLQERKKEKLTVAKKRRVTGYLTSPYINISVTS